MNQVASIPTAQAVTAFDDVRVKNCARFLAALFTVCQSGKKIKIGEITREYRIGNNAVKLLKADGVLTNPSKGVWNWVGPYPSEKMAEDLWQRHLEFLANVHRNKPRARIVNPEALADTIIERLRPQLLAAIQSTLAAEPAQNTLID